MCKRITAVTAELSVEKGGSDATLTSLEQRTFRIQQVHELTRALVQRSGYRSKANVLNS